MILNMDVRQKVSIVQLADSLTSANADSLVAQFASWLDRKNPARCIFDLSKLEILDSSGVGSIVTCLHKVKRLDGDLCLAAAQGRTATVLAIAHLDLIFKMYPTVDAALASCVAP